MASIHKRGSSFEVRYRDPKDGTNRSKAFGSHREAAAFRASVEVDVATGQYVSPVESNRRFVEALRTWLDTKTRRADYEQTLLSISRKWIGLPYDDGEVRPATDGRPFADLPLGAISAADIEDVLRQMKHAGRSSAYRRKCYQIIDGTFKLAITQRRLTFNPCTAIAEVPSPAPRRKAKPIPDVVIRQLIDQLRFERDRVFVMWLAYTGCRPVEALALRVGDLDLERRRVTVQTAKGHDDHERTRVIGLAEPLMDVLQAYSEGRSADQWLFPDRRTPDQSFGLTAWRNNVWNPAKKAIGQPRIQPYDLRHTCASRLLANGATMVDVARWLGHEKVSTTSDIYAHLLDEDKHADRLAALLT
ncbi:tyrosine-type recombinase/integrase [Euzebya tangerina]|uniref:tyrosine-type recombinase/integrase n=1 Tax=Euzebya tangerina TaxID=591198 RepID=UPI0013C346B1|nr:site-specific integrase [Euzebya tangerina]